MVLEWLPRRSPGSQGMVDRNQLSWTAPTLKSCEADWLLLGCLEDNHRLLVYEFMSRGSLDNHLFRRASYFQPLSWSLHMKIALGTAEGLAFLHSDEAKVIYQDFKTFNILLDSACNAKLSDFGLAKDGPAGDKSHVSTRVMGTYRSFNRQK